MPVVSNSSEQDAEFMRRAVLLAEQGIGQTSPNPAVGAVIAHEGRVVGEGYHRKCGTPHAERVAIANAEENGFTQWEEATLYCTLEPCSTVGRTGACSTAILEKGMKRVVYGSQDPNPAHAGKVNELFQKEGIEVTAGVLEKECDFLIRGFRRMQETGLPWVILKSAMSLDGKITRPEGEGQWLTNKGSRLEVHKLRAEVDAIITGGNTVRKDAPRLTVRLPDRASGLRQPKRVILTRDRDSLPKEVGIVQDPETIIYEEGSLKEALRDLGSQGVNTVLIEAGGALLGAFCDEKLVDEVVIFYAPLLTGGEAMAVSGEGAKSLEAVLRLEQVQYTQIGDDLMMRGEISRSPAGGSNLK